MGGLPPPVPDTHGISLPARYTIRPLDASMVAWAKALQIEGFMLRNSSLWAPLVPEPRAASALRAFSALDGHFAHAITSGVSFGIFDAEYSFRRPESAAVAATASGSGSTQGGALYWHELDPGAPGFEARGPDLMRAAMDFPLVCAALAVDARDPTPDAAAADLARLMPLARGLSLLLADLRRRSNGNDKEETAPASAAGPLLVRSGCVTRAGYEGRGLMTALNHFVLLEARARGYAAVSAGVADPAVFRNWMRAPAGCRTRVIARFDLWAVELEDERGRRVRPYAESGVGREGWLLWCDVNLV